MAKKSEIVVSLSDKEVEQLVELSRASGGREREAVIKQALRELHDREKAKRTLVHGLSRAVAISSSCAR
jgi:metal-responsive CopG/Arc/MetJ family transcriptional regulator